MGGRERCRKSLKWYAARRALHPVGDTATKRCWRTVATTAGICTFLKVLAGASALAVDPRELAACRPVTDLIPRLACYDGLGQAQSAAVAEAAPARVIYAYVSLPDLKADKESLFKTAVTTFGRLQVQGPLVFLRTLELDNAPLSVSIARLPSEQQKLIKARCTSPCPATVKGKVLHVALGFGLVAEEIVID